LPNGAPNTRHQALCGGAANLQLAWEGGCASSSHHLVAPGVASRTLPTKHTPQGALHHKDHASAVAHKNATVVEKRMDRHSGNGHALSPKKGGAGKGGIGT
jgi:hypothetical protein